MKTFEEKYGFTPATDGEIQGFEYTIPDGFTAEIKDGKVIVKKQESEDERIRKGLIEYLESDRDYQPCQDVSFYDDAIAYLEKQKDEVQKQFNLGMQAGREEVMYEMKKEQKPSVEEVLIRAGLKPYKDGNQWCILIGDNIQEGICGFGDTIDDALYHLLREAIAYQKEQKPFNDTQEYLRGVVRVQGYDELTKFEKIFDRIADTYARRKNKDGYNEPWYTKERAAEMLYHAKEELGLFLEQKPAECINIEKLAEHIKAEFESFRKLLKKKGIDYQPADVYWTDYARLFVSSAKKLQKPAEWSDEDDAAYDDLIWCIEQAKKSAKDVNDIVNIWFAENWVKKRIKSLHPQPHWKPSEEQMESLMRTITWLVEKGNHMDSSTLADLRCNLQKL